ncbi:MAG: hypothetical protein H7175_01780 [Burkholderiales bacterium]|nr:hypothetical protein [Anaerolineae bacterium]
MKNLKIVLLMICLAAIGSVSAQSNPTVEIVLSQPTAQQGDIVTADVYVRNGVNVAGVDIGLTTDEECLRIVERQPGDYLPTTGEQGGFSPFEEMTDHATRFAAALTDRTRYANGDGIFFSIQLEVTCEEGTAPLDITYAKIATYEDPSAVEINLISFDMAEDTLNAIGAQLAIGPADQVTPIATATSEAGEAISATPAPTTEAAPQSQTLIVVAVIMIVVAVGGLLLLLLVARRRRSRKQ